MRPDRFERFAKWESDNEIPDPEVLPVVSGWKLLIRPIAIKEKTEGGLYIPDMAKDDLEYLITVGKVLAMGPLCYTRKDMLVDGKPSPWCKVGDYIVYPKYVGNKIKYDGIKLLIMNDDEPLMTITDPDLVLLS